MENEKIINQTPRKERFKFAQHEEIIHDTKFETKSVSYLQDCLRRFAKNKASVVASFIILFIALFAIIGPIVNPRTYIEDSFNVEEYEEDIVKFAHVTPRNEWFVDAGFWDGKETAEISINEYELKRYSDSNYKKFDEDTIEEFIPEEYRELQELNPNFNVDAYKMYRVERDNYAIGCYDKTLTYADYQALVQYEIDHGIHKDITKSIIKPVVDYAPYLEELKAELTAKGINAESIINNMRTSYSTDKNIFFKLYPVTRTGSTELSDTTFVPRLDDNGNICPLYKTDADNNLVWALDAGGEMKVRVDFYDYFTYKYGFTPNYLLGADSKGEDILLSLALGARFSLLLGVGITVINFLIGLIWGSISGYYGGTVDLTMERLTDIIANIPTIIIMSIAQIQFTHNDSLRATLGPAGIIIAAILVAFVYNGWVGVAATTRMQFYRFKGQEYVLASRTLGAKDSRLIFKHILPNSAGTLVTRSVLLIPGIIFSESSLSYLGIIDFEGSGIYSVGNMLSKGQSFINTYPHELLFPCLLISLLMISFNLFGNGLRDAFNTSLRGSED